MNVHTKHVGMIAALLLAFILVISGCAPAEPTVEEEPTAAVEEPTAEPEPEPTEEPEEVEPTEEPEEVEPTEEPEEVEPTEEPAEESSSASEEGPILFFAPVELSGAGATVGTNWRDGVQLAVEDINAEGGILGRQVEVLFEDTQSDPATSKAVIAKGLEENPYAIVGPLYSGSIIVNMVEAERAQIPQIVGGEGANLTQQGNQYIFRTSFGQSTSMPKLASYMEESGITSVDIVWINNEFGKGGRDAITAEFDARGIEVMNDISAEEQQADFAPEALTVLGSDAEALFVYMNEEESARLLVELNKQGFDKPILGETVLIAQSVIDLAGEASNGTQGHVGLTANAPIPAIEEYAARFEEKFEYVPDHNGLKGYIAMHVLKEGTERLGEFDSQKLAESLHCTIITTEDEPGVLMDIVYDENGDVDRESFLVEVQDEQQVVTEVLPRLGGTCGEEEEMASEEEEEMASEEEEEAPAVEASGEPVLLFAPAELSGAGATVGTNWKNGVELAIKDINAAGGILGRPVEALFEDTQSDPATSKAVIAKGLEENPYAIVGPLYSGSIIVNMVEAERAQIPQIVGGEGANLTQQGNQYIFRTSFGQSTSMPKLASYMEESGITSVDIVWINNEFGKGGRDAITAELDARGIEIMNDISAEEQQADFAPEALTVLGSDADALFVYMNEEESARLLVELNKQGFEKPILGETVLIAQSVIDLAGEASNGTQGHVGLTANAPIPAIEEYAARFEEEFGYVPDHNGLKGYIGVHVIKEMTERMGEFDSQKLAEDLHCTIITTEDEPGVLMDIVYDENGDVDRESFLVEVQDEQQVVTEVLPRLGNTCGEDASAASEEEEASEEEAPAPEEEEEAPAVEASGEPVLLFAPAELSGAGATVGTNWKNGVELAIEDINAAGGILGRPVEALFEDTQSDPATSKAVIAKGLEENPYAIVGPLYSGSIIVNMVEAERAQIPQIVGGEGANLTQQGNQYIFRTSFGQATSMPKLASYMEESGITSVDIVWINNEFGKGGRDAITAEFDARGIEILNDISAEEQQADFAPEALTVLGSGADALFVYMNEEESARLLVELNKQGFEKPIFGETVLIAQSVIDLAGEASNGTQGHVGLTASAPIPAIEEYAARFEEKFGYVPDHNGLKGYIGVHVIKEMTERMGEFDSQKLAEDLHCTIITTEDEPGVLMDIVYDENGDVDRESFLVEVQDGQQVVTEVLPRLGGTCGEEGAEEADAEEEATTEASGEPVLLFAPAELSGAGATVGTNWKNGVELAIEDINGAGGILGRPVEALFEDTQSDPATSKAVIAKGLEENPYAIVGPLYSGSIIVNMVEAERAEIPQIVGGEGANLTQQGNPYIFRTSFGQATSMPKLASYMEESGITSVDIVWINNEFGKGGRDAITAEFDARGIEILNDISAEEQQADFAPEALTVLGSGADALFVYMNEEESARLLVELNKQGFESPIFGETVLIAQSVIDLAGEAANGAQGHVGLTASAPIPAIEEYAARFEEKFGYVPDHNGLKGYIGVHVIKEMTERMGEFDSQKLAEELHCTIITTEDEPGVLMDIVYDENGDVDRESFLVEVQDEQQVVTEVLPRLGGTCGEE